MSSSAFDMEDVLERPVTSYMHRLYVIIDENTNVASAVKQMNLNKAEIIVVSKNGIASGIVTDGDILEEVVIKGEDSDYVSLSCDAGDAAIGGKMSPNASMVSLFQSGDHSGAFKAQIILNFADFEEPGPRSIEITAVCAHLPTDG